MTKPNVLRVLPLLLIVLMGSSYALAGDETGKSKQAKKPRAAKKQICISFDELPVAESFTEADRTEIIERILAVLKKHKVKAAGFVVGSRIENSYDLLGKWLNAGHRLGNMTYSLQDFNELEVDPFINDIVAGADALETMLSGFGQKPRFFRYPFLHYGTTIDKKRGISDFLDAHNIVVAHATVVVEDYLYNLAAEKEGQLDSATYDELLNEYVNHVLDEIERCEILSRQVLKRPCRQILQLRANLLNATFLDELLTAIEEMDYKFVSLDYALKDKLYIAPEGYIDLRGVGYLDMLLLSDPDLLPAE